MRWKGKELLTSCTIEPVFYGATLWPDPQGKWWPVPVELDGDPYILEHRDNREIRMTSLSGNCGLQFTKTFTLVERDSAVEIVYKITNVSLTEKKTGFWELLRTGGGQTFFPASDADVLPQSDLGGVNVTQGIAQYHFVKPLLRKAGKLFCMAEEGWISHRIGDLLFIKQYPDMHSNDIAPGQGEVEIYVNADASYIELETHGKYSSLQPNQSATYRSKWFLRDIPESMNNNKVSEWASFVRNFLIYHQR